jgi:hypothetical protein
VLGNVPGHVTKRLETKKAALTKVFLFYNRMSENFASILILLLFVCDYRCEPDVVLNICEWLPGGEFGL